MRTVVGANGAMYGEKSTITIKAYFIVVTLNLSQRKYFVSLVYSIFELFAREVVDKLCQRCEHVRVL